MIKETTRTIHFLPFEPRRGRTKDTSSAPRVRVSTKYSNIVFGAKAIADMQMAGMFVKLYYEPQKRIIGWKLKETITQQEMKNWKLCRPAKSTGTWAVSIGTMVAQFKGLTKESYNLEVKKWRDTTPLGGGDVYYFVKVSDTQDED